MHGRTASAAFDANDPSRLGGIEIPQRSNGLPCRDVLSLFGGTQRFAVSQLG
jgi:hypothetical protein